MSSSKAAGSKVGVECIIPILRVNSIVASIRFYVDVLGFEVDWGGEAESTFASVSRDGRAIMLCQGGQGQPGTWIWIGVEDIEPLFAEYRAKGVKFREPPTNYPWAYEMKIEDPDAHVLRFGSEAKDGLICRCAAGLLHKCHKFRKHPSRRELKHNTEILAATEVGGAIEMATLVAHQGRKGITKVLLTSGKLLSKGCVFVRQIFDVDRAANRARTSIA